MPKVESPEDLKQAMKADGAEPMSAIKNPPPQMGIEGGDSQRSKQA